MSSQAYVDPQRPHEVWARFHSDGSKIIVSRHMTKTAAERAIPMYLSDKSENLFLDEPGEYYYEYRKDTCSRRLIRKADNEFNLLVKQHAFA